MVLTKLHTICLKTFSGKSFSESSKNRLVARMNISRFALATDCRPDSRIGLTLLICRAHDVARTTRHPTRHARHVTHDTSRTTRHVTRTLNSNVNNYGLGTPLVSHPQPSTHECIYFGICSYCLSFFAVSGSSINICILYIVAFLLWEVGGA